MTAQPTKRLLKLREPVFETKIESKSKVDSDEDSPFEKTEFVCYDNTIIRFGKLKGRPHSELLKPENLNYANWIMNQNKNEKFYYKATVKYLEKRLRSTADNLDITSTDYIFLADKVNPTAEELRGCGILRTI